MPSPIQWAWVWVNSRSCWWTGRPGMLQSMGSQRVGHYWATELNWIVYVLLVLVGWGQVRNITFISFSFLFYFYFCFSDWVIPSSLYSRLVKFQQVNPKGNQSWILIERTDVEAETPVLCPPDAKSWLIWKDPNAGKDWRWEEKGTTEDEIVGWHHWLNEHEFEQTQGYSEGQGSLVCHSLVAKIWTWLSDCTTTMDQTP